MNTNPNCEYEKIVKYRNSLYDWFNQYQWKWFVSLNIPYSGIDSTERYLKKWRQTISTNNKIQICYMGVVVSSKIQGNHIHLLMNDSNKDSHILQIPDNKKVWNDISHRTCDIQLVRDDGVIDYIVNKNTPHGHFQLVNPYNKKLLEKYRKFNSLQI